jgi:hypothetical protein
MIATRRVGIEENVVHHSDEVDGQAGDGDAALA